MITTQFKEELQHLEERPYSWYSGWIWEKDKHMSLEERDRVAEMKSFGHTVTEIAKELGRSKSTLSRELRRNATPAYKVYLDFPYPP